MQSITEAVRTFFFILVIQQPWSSAHYVLTTCQDSVLAKRWLRRAAAAKSLQSCLTLCDPIDGNPSGFSVPGILQARILEWVAISFSNTWKWKWSRSVVSDSMRPHGLQPTRLLRPRDFPGKSTGVGCHCLLPMIVWPLTNSDLSTSVNNNFKSNFNNFWDIFLYFKCFTSFHGGQMCHQKYRMLN